MPVGDEGVRGTMVVKSTPKSSTHPGMGASKIHEAPPDGRRLRRRGAEQTPWDAREVAEVKHGSQSRARDASSRTVSQKPERGERAGGGRKAKWSGRDCMSVCGVCKLLFVADRDDVVSPAGRFDGRRHSSCAPVDATSETGGCSSVRLAKMKMTLIHAAEEDPHARSITLGRQASLNTL